MSLVADTGRMYLCFVCTICFSLYRLLFPFGFRSLPGILPLHKSKGSWCLKDWASILTWCPSVLFFLESYGKGLIRQCPWVCWGAGLPQGRHPDCHRAEHRRTGRMVALLLARSTRHCPRQSGEAPDWPHSGDPLRSGPAYFWTDAPVLWPTEALSSAKPTRCSSRHHLSSAIFLPTSGNLPGPH